MSLKQRRLELIKDIIHKDSARYGYLPQEPFQSHITGNYTTYPNDFLQTLYNQIVEMTEYHPETMKDHPTWGAKYIQFCNDYMNCYTAYAQMIQQQQQQQQEILAAYLAQQQQQAYQQQYAQQQYAQYQQPQQQFSQQYQQPQQYYPKQNQYINQQQQQQGYQQQYQQRNYQHKSQNYYQQGQQQTDQQGQPRYQQNRQQGFQRQNRYQNQGEQTEGGYQQQGGYRQHGHYQQGHYQKPHYQQQPQPVEHLEEAPAVVEEKVVVEEKIVVPPPPPPKPEPQPMKFSLSEIRSFISTWSDKDKELVSKDLIEKVNEVNLWTKSEASFEEKPEKPQQERKQYGKRGERGDRGDRQQRDGQQQGFVTGSKYSKPSEAPELQLQRKDTGLKIVVGKNQTLEAKMIKKEIKEKAGQDFATLMEKENESLDQLAISKKEIIYNLNLLAPENLKDIQKDLTQYLFNDRDVCEVLIEQIIEKAWGQPKYASTYAKLCSEFSKVPGDKFTFQSSKEKRSDKKENPFKVFLISKVQHSFDKKLEEVPDFTNDQQRENWLRDTKKKILGNVKFIAELIRSKVLKKRIMKICISQLIFTFLSKYYYFMEQKKFIDSYYDYYFEALIEFIENVGEFYEKLDEASEKKEEKTASYEDAEKVVIELIDKTRIPPEEEIQELTNLKADDYFKLFNIIDQKILREKNTRLSALLLNLTERRSNNWQKHHSQADGPKKLKEIKEDIAKEENEMNKVKQQKKESLEHLRELVKAMYKDWDGGEKNERAHFKNILKEYKEVEFLTECLNQIADAKKELVAKRVALFDVILESYSNPDTLKAAWFESIKFMAFNSGDFPFACSAIALVLKKIFTKDANKLKEFFMKTEDQDEQYFVEQVYGRLYHYTKMEEIKQLTEPNKKYSNQLDG